MSEESKRGSAIQFNSQRVVKREKKVVVRGPDGKNHIVRRVLTYNENGQLIHPPDAANYGQGYIKVDEVHTDEEYSSIIKTYKIEEDVDDDVFSSIVEMRSKSTL